MRWWKRWKQRWSVLVSDPAATRAAHPPVFEALEPRLLLAGDLPSITMIEADNRGTVILRASADLDAATVTGASVQVTTAGADQIFGTADDAEVSRTVEYRASDRTIRINAGVAADARYRVRLDGSVIKGIDGRLLDGEFRGATTISGDGVQGGDLVFFTRRPTEFVVRFTTISGILDVTMFRDRTPLTVQNFLNYANRGVWDTTIIHRSVSGFVIQGGGFFSSPPFSRIPQDPPVRNEPGISNIRGTIAMAKQAGNPNSATNEWFFNLANNSSNLDNQNGGFTAFGEVRNASGLAVMDALAAFLVVNAQQVNGAFTEIPVVDRNAVLTRPGSLMLFTSDVIRIDRIALLVDVTDQPAQQLPADGSVIFSVPGVEGGARVQVFDLDQAGLGPLSNSILVRFGRNNSIASITLRDGLPAARIGIAITGATSVGGITDLRRDGSGSIAFLASSAPVGSIRLATAPSGFDLNGFVVPGLALDDDIDNDGIVTDPLSIFIASGPLTTLNLPGGVTGDVIVPGGLGSVIVGGVARNADFVGASTPTGTPLTFLFHSVIDSEIRVADPITSVRATEWLDVSTRQERIVTPTLHALIIIGDARNSLAGNFEAGLDLSQSIGGRPTLGVASIAGSIFGSDWVVRGAIGSISLRGDATNFSITSATEANTIIAGRLSNVNWTFSRRVGRVSVVEWTSGQFTAASLPTMLVRGDPRQGLAGDFIANLTVNGGGTIPVIRSLTINGVLRDSTTTITGSVTNLFVRGGLHTTNLRVGSGDLRTMDTGPIINSTVNVQRTLFSLAATRIEGSSLQGGTFDAIVTRGDARAGIRGDFAGEIRPTVVNRLDVKGDFAGVLTIRQATNITIAGNMTASTVNFSLTPNPTVKAFQNFGIGGRMENTDFRAAARVGNLAMAAMIHSGVYVGAPANIVGLPASNQGFRNGSGIDMVNVRGLPGGVPAFDNSFIVALDIDTARINGINSANFGRVFGLAFGTVDLVESRTIDGVTQRLNDRSTTPTPIGDYHVWINFTPPPGTVV
jgi:cyclophilin family peptidyl-prolyl cis-trans isomerase